MIPHVSQPFLSKITDAGLTAKMAGNALLISYISLAANIYLAMFLDYQDHRSVFNILIGLSLLGNLFSFGLSLLGMLRFRSAQVRFSILLAGNLAMLWLASVVS